MAITIMTIFNLWLVFVLELFLLFVLGLLLCYFYGSESVLIHNQPIEDIERVDIIDMTNSNEVRPKQLCVSVNESA